MEYIRRILREYITSDEDSKLMGEGLIKTINPDKVATLLNRFAKDNLKVEVVKNGESLGFIVIYLKKDKTKPYIDNIISYMNNMGYFLTSFFDEKDEEYINPDEIDKYIGKVDSLRFEPKFDIEYTPTQKYLYHVTNSKYLGKILKIGLTPRSQSKLGYHPERIYLAKTIEKANEIRQVFYAKGFESDEGLKMLQIDLINLFAFFRYDGQFDGGIYTTDNIPPDHIKVL